MDQEVTKSPSNNLTSNDEKLLSWDIQIRSKGTIGWDFGRRLGAKVKALVRVLFDDA